jgi:hypothetical protein
LCLTLFGVLTVVFIIIQYFMKEHATVPFGIISQRSVAAASWFAFTVGGAFFVLIYWVPIWFQAIKGATAFKSGIDSLPLVLGVVVASILGGGLTTALGHYWPFYWLSVILSSIGAGLLTTFEVHTGHEKWIGYQAIYGLGVGFGLQQALVTVQAVLPLHQVPTGTALVMFMQTFGGALFVSVAQNVFNNRLGTSNVCARRRPRNCGTCWCDLVGNADTSKVSGRRAVCIQHRFDGHLVYLRGYGIVVDHRCNFRRVEERQGHETGCYGCLGGAFVMLLV